LLPKRHDIPYSGSNSHLRNLFRHLLLH